MPENEMNEILQRLTRVETKLDIMNSARDIAQEALQSTKAAHHRCDEIRSELERLKIKQTENQKWLIGTLISCGGLLVAAASLFVKVVIG